MKKEEHETERVEELLSYKILDTPEEDSFDNLVKVSAFICNTEFAQINFIDAHRQWTKAWHNVDIKEIPREYGFCNHTIKNKEKMIVTDTLKDDRFAEKEFVTEEPKIRFYAGVNIKSKKGYNIGTICVMGTEPKDLNKHQQETLAREVEARIELKKSNQQLEKKAIYLKNSTDLMLLVDSKNLIILEVNEEVEKFFDFDTDHLIDRSITSLNISEFHIKNLQNWIENNNSEEFSEVINVPGKDSELYFQVNISKKDDHLFITARDITEDQRNLEQLNKNFKYQATISEVSLVFNSSIAFKEKVNKVLEIIGSVSKVCRSYIFIDFNDGQNCRNEFEWCGEGVSEQIHELQNISYKEDVPQWKETLIRDKEIISSDVTELSKPLQDILAPQSIKSIIVLPIYKDEVFMGFIGFDDTKTNRVWSDAEIFLLRTTAGLISNAYSKNETFQMLQNSERRLMNFIKQSPVSIAMLDKQLKFIETSNKWLSDYGNGKRNLAGVDYTHNEKDYKKTGDWEDIFKAVLAGNTYFLENQRLEKKDGSELWLTSKIIPWYTENEEVGGVIIFVDDVTKLIKNNLAIKKSLKEKEVLITEIHHRVKNNLATVSAFLELEQLMLENEKASKIIQKSLGRIQVMANIHELLYESESFADISLSKMCKKLFERIESGLGVNSRIFFKIDIIDIFLTINDAIPVALMLNEMVANSLEYIRHSNLSAKFTIKVTEGKNQRINVSVSHNQSSLARSNPLDSDSSLDITILKVLAEQVDGELSYGDEKTIGWKLNFKKNKSRGSSSNISKKKMKELTS
ncbi:MAG: PAS domain S-box protein [Balneolaceae bacterium]|nr:PAS domain S-box protein [Balneolaceae bacterium]MBO6547102.1 PAS domain S-box protein [Balneolaceae bacterium]MBO6647951.1 PAS domain S-box protein [Balneolaceae bacterium]